MRILMVAALLSLSASALAGEPAPPPSNMDFEQGAVGAPPPGWSGAALVTADDGAYQGMKYARLDNPSAPTAGFMNVIDAGPYRGRRLLFRAAVRATVEGDGGAGLWLRAAGPDGETLAFRNTVEQLVRGKAWTTVEVGIDVPADASRLVFGGLLVGKGVGGFDAAALDLKAAPTGPMTPAARIYLSHALDILQARHINSATANWVVLRAKATEIAAHAQTPGDTYPAIDYVIRALGESHSSLRWPPAAGPTRIEAPHTRLIPDIDLSRPPIGVLRLPMLMTVDDPTPAFARRYEQVLRDGIEDGRTRGVCGWVVDLRQNGGGNMWPMVRGLAPLIGPPPQPGVVSPDGAYRGWEWPKPRILISAPIAVLIGPGTASSGEMTALAFVRRPNARLFGAPTAGLATSNIDERLSDGAVLLVTTAKVADRTGRIVDGPIRPDQTTSEETAEDVARAWLSRQGCTLRTASRGD